MKLVEIDVDGVNDECDVHEVDLVDVDGVGDAKDVGDVVSMKLKVEFGSSCFGKRPFAEAFGNN